MEFGVLFTSHSKPEAMRSLRLFTERVIPAFRPPAERMAAAA